MFTCAKDAALLAVSLKRDELNASALSKSTQANRVVRGDFGLSINWHSQLHSWRPLEVKR